MLFSEADSEMSFSGFENHFALRTETQYHDIISIGNAVLSAAIGI